MPYKIIWKNLSRNQYLLIMESYPESEDSKISIDISTSMNI